MKCLLYSILFVFSAPSINAEMEVYVTVNGKAMESTIAETYEDIFSDGFPTIENMTEALVGTKLFQLSWDDDTRSSITVTSNKNYAVLVAVWEHTDRVNGLINLLEAEGLAMKNDVEIWWNDETVRWQSKYRKTKGILSKTLQTGDTFSFIRPENHLPISIFVIEDDCSQSYCEIRNEDGEINEIDCGSSGYSCNSPQWCSGSSDRKQSFWANHTSHADPGCFSMDAVSCGNTVISPRCSLCPKSYGLASIDWCSGNCDMNKESGFCKDRYEYTKVHKVGCRKTEMEYANIYDAKMACSVDADCIGVLDEDCTEYKRDKSFVVCTNTIEVEHHSDCVYKKQELRDHEVCFDIKVSTLQHGVHSKWKLGHCNSIGIDYDNKMQYIHKCCLKPGLHTLTCINKREPYGWDEGYIEIQGHRYCNDFLSYRLMQRITIKGI